MTTYCLIDGQAAGEEFLCLSCRVRLCTDLRQLAHGGVDAKGNRIPGLYSDLEDAIGRLNNVSTGPRTSSKGAEKPLLINLGASALRWELDNEISTWARDLAECNPHLHLTAESIPDAAEWMARLPTLLACHPAADELYRAITRMVDRVRRMLEGAQARVFMGQCGGQFVNVLCTEDIYGLADEHGRPDLDQRDIRCHTCGTRHNVADRRETVMQAVRDSWSTAYRIAQAVPIWFGARIHVKTIRTWAARGKIATREQTDGTPLHQVGEVLDYASQTRRGHSGSAA